MEAEYAINKKAKPQLRLVLYSSIMAVIIQLLVSMISEQGTFLRRLISPSDSMFENIVPFTIIFLWIWTMLDITSKARMALKQRKHLQVLQQTVHAGRGGDISGLEALHDTSEENYANRRISELLMQMKAIGDSHQAHEHFRHQLVIDADQTAGGYTLAKVFIWAMPIVGFIGTVSGIGWAVAEFASFLTSKMTVDDIESVKHALAGVAGGLSYAFDTTLLGLTASIVAMLFMSYVQRNDEGFLSDLEQLGLEVLTLFGVKHKTQESETEGVGIDVDRLLSEMNESVEHLVGNINQLGNGIPPVIDSVSRTIAPLGQKLEASITEMQQAIQNKVNELSQEEIRSRTDVASMHTTLLGISEKLEKICDSMTVSMTSGDDERAKSDMASLRDGLQGMSVRLEQICSTLAGLHGRSAAAQTGEIRLSEDSRHYLGSEVSRLIDSISHQISSGMKHVRQERMHSVGVTHTLPSRMPLWRAATLGVAMLLFTALAVSSIISMQKMRTLVQENQMRDASFSANVIKIVQSLDAARSDLKDGMSAITQALATPTAAGVASGQMESDAHQATNTAASEEVNSTSSPATETTSVEAVAQPDSPNKVDEWLAYAEAAFAKDYLLTPEDESAVYWVNRVLELEPDNRKAIAIRAEVIDRYLDWAAKQIIGERIQAASVSLSKVESLSGHASPRQRSKLSALKDELNILVRKKAARSAAIDRPASVQPKPSPEKSGAALNAASTNATAQHATVDSVIPKQPASEVNKQIQGETPAQAEQTQGTNNPIKAIGNLFKRVFKNETASDN